MVTVFVLWTSWLVLMALDAGRFGWSQMPVWAQGIGAILIAPCMTIACLAFAITGWVTTARLVRGQVLSLKEKEFVEAARAVGVPTPRILLRHILPHTLAPIIVAVSFGIPSYILAEAGLSFLGIGIQPPTASWGSMVFSSYPQMTFQPIFVIMPAALIAAIMMAFAFLGDGLRDALDPQMN